MRLHIIVLVLLTSLAPNYAHAQYGMCAALLHGWFAKKTVTPKLTPYFDRTSLEEKFAIINRFDTKSYPRSRFVVPTKTFRDLLEGKLVADGRSITYSRIDFATIKGKQEIDHFLATLNYLMPAEKINPLHNANSRQLKATALFAVLALWGMILTQDAEYDIKLAELILLLLGFNGYTFWNWQHYESERELPSEIDEIDSFERVFAHEKPELGDQAVLIGNRYGHSNVLFMLSEEDREYRLDIVHWAIHFKGD